MFKSLKKKKEQDNNVYNGFDHNLTLITKLFRDIENSTLCEIAEITNEEIEVVRAYRNKIKPDSPKYQEPYYAKDVKQMLEKNLLIPIEVEVWVNKVIDFYLKDATPVMGMCHSIWKAKKQLFDYKGYEWYSPKDLEPGTMFD
jgi:hypothetical protein